MKRLAWMILITGLFAIAQKLVPADVIKSMKTIYVCGLVDGATKVYAAEGNSSGEAKTRRLAKDSGCDEILQILGVDRP